MRRNVLGWRGFLVRGGGAEVCDSQAVERRFARKVCDSSAGADADANDHDELERFGRGGAELAAEPVRAEGEPFAHALVLHGRAIACRSCLQFHYPNCKLTVNRSAMVYSLIFCCVLSMLEAHVQAHKL